MPKYTRLILVMAMPLPAGVGGEGANHISSYSTELVGREEMESLFRWHSDSGGYKLMETVDFDVTIVYNSKGFSTVVVVVAVRSDTHQEGVGTTDDHHITLSGNATLILPRFLFHAGPRRQTPWPWAPCGRHSYYQFPTQNPFDICRYPPINAGGAPSNHGLVVDAYSYVHTVTHTHLWPTLKEREEWWFLLLHFESFSLGQLGGPLEPSLLFSFLGLSLLRPPPDMQLSTSCPYRCIPPVANQHSYPPAPQAGTWRPPGSAYK